MTQVRDILQTKGSHVWSIGPGATALQGAKLMTEHRIGSLVVLEQGRVAGMFTERDLLRLVSDGRDPSQTPVGEAMTAEVVCCAPTTPLEEAKSAMKNRRVRHLPVLGDDENLLGVISIGDLNAHETADHQQTIFLMSEYIYGRV
ncbi:MAG TPA: CBS domain-containing protein [Gemmataceae bacterium]|nr:CBS domain-containing protein [Gemmataceae bacterium]